MYSKANDFILSCILLTAIKLKMNVSAYSLLCMALLPIKITDLLQQSLPVYGQIELGRPAAGAVCVLRQSSGICSQDTHSPPLAAVFLGKGRVIRLTVIFRKHIFPLTSSPCFPPSLHYGHWLSGCCHSDWRL